MILGYKVENSSSGTTIKSLMQDATKKHKPQELQFLTDGGTENINHTVSNFIDSSDVPIDHVIAQKDVVFSNSMIEAFNKVIKHQFLFHNEITSREELKKCLKQAVTSYNTVRPQMSLGGNTPIETYQGKPIQLTQYKTDIELQKGIRRLENRGNACNLCH